VITQDRSDGILTVMIDNEARANSLTAPMLNDLAKTLESASADETLRAVLLTSAGSRGFSAGMDTSQFDHESPTHALETITSLGRVCEAAKDCDIPVAAAIRGYCIGGALEITAAADFRVGGEKSWYSMPEVRIGIPSVLDSANLYRLMGWTKATELILTANRFSASDMAAYGFLNTVVADDQVHDRTLAYLSDTVKSDRSVIAQQKRLFRTWKNTFEREAVEDSKKEFALAFARKGN
jgi:enoyl-CoA hydratase